MTAEVEERLARVFHAFGADHDEFLNDGLEPASRGRVANGGVGRQQGRLSHGSQHVVGEHGERQDQVVGGELAGRQPFQVEVGQSVRAVYYRTHVAEAANSFTSYRKIMGLRYSLD